MRERSLPVPFAPSDRVAIVSRGRQAIVKSPRPISRDARVPRYTALRAAIGLNGWGRCEEAPGKPGHGQFLGWTVPPGDRPVLSLDDGPPPQPLAHATGDPTSLGL